MEESHEQWKREREMRERELERMLELRTQERASRRKRMIYLAGVAFATLVVSFSLFAQLQYREARSAHYSAMLASERAARSEDLERQLRELVKQRDDVAQLRSAVASITQVPPEAKVSAALGEVTQKADQLSQRLKLLEDAILTTPDKALSIPLLRKDLENEHSTAAADSAAIRQEIARLYDFNKWFFGLIATMALSTFGFAVSNFFKKKEPEKEPNEGA